MLCVRVCGELVFLVNASLACSGHTLLSSSVTETLQGGSLTSVRLQSPCLPLHPHQDPKTPLSSNYSIQVLCL